MSAAEVRLAALCDHALVAQDGKVTLVGIFRNIGVSALPAEHPRMFLVAILTLAAGAHRVVVQLRLPDGAASMPNPPELSVQGVAGQDVNVIIELNKITFTVHGEHHFEISVDGDLAGSVPVTIGQIQQPQPGRRSN